MALGDDNLGGREAREYWRIGGQPVGEDPHEEVRTFETLELTFYVPLVAVQEVLRPLRDDAGAFNILERSDGGFVAVDTSDGNNTIKVDAPTSRQDVRRQRDYLVADYDEEMQDAEGEKYEVELELVPEESKPQYSGHVSETAASDEWLLEFDAGAIATGNVSAEIIESHDEGVETIGLDLVLSGSQVRRIEESARKLFAAHVTDQFDGTSRAEDLSPGEVNTIELTPPDGGDKTVDPGSYVVSAWETEWRRDNIYDVALELLKTDRKTFFSAGYIADSFAAN